MKQRCSGAIYRTNNSAIYRANKSKVYLAGAGPGDPGLITLKAIECLKKAKVIIYDRLVNPELLKYAPKTRKYYMPVSQRAMVRLPIAAAGRPLKNILSPRMKLTD